MQRAVLDTNVLVSATLNPRGAPERLPVLGTLRLCRNPDDDIVLETAVRGGADTLVSRDEDLTRAPDLAAALARHGIAAMTVRQFLAALDAELPASAPPADSQ